MSQRITEDFAWEIYNLINDWKDGKKGIRPLQEVLDEKYNKEESSLKKVAESLIKHLEESTPEELEAEYESITHEKFYDRWTEKIHSLTPEKRKELIEKARIKYISNEYRESEYDKGYEPREELFNLLYQYAVKYSKDILEEREEDGDILNFCNGLYLVDGTYFVELMCGQGSVINVFTKDEWTARQRYLKRKRNFNDF